MYLLAFRGTEKILEFHPMSRDMNKKPSNFCSILNYDFVRSKGQKLAYISASRRKLKNRLGAPKSNQMRGLSPKNEPIGPRGLGCRGGECQ